MMHQELFDVSIPMAGIDQTELDAKVDDLRTEMADAGITHGILVADKRGPQGRADSVRADWGRIRDFADQYPTVFSPAIGIDPTSGGMAAQSVAEAVGEGAVAAHAIPHAFGLAPDNPHWSPFYATCADLGIPIIVELGIRHSVGTRVRSVGRPICLDAVACDFPDLTIVAVGPWPWVEEAISMAYKHERVYLAVGGNDPGHHHPSLLRYTTSWGKHKVVFASSGTDPAASVARTRAMGLDEAAREALGRQGRDLFLSHTVTQ